MVVLRRALPNTRKEQYMKILEKTVHFTCEGTSIGCYASKVKSKCKELAKAAGEVW